MVERITPKEAQQRMAEGWIYLDVRSEEEFAQGHPEGAWNLPFALATPSGMQPNPRFLEVAKKALRPDGRYVVGCQAGGRSGRAVQVLEASGFNVVDQSAGFGGQRDPSGRIVQAGWAAEKLPVQSGQPSGRSYRDLDK